MSIYAMTLLRDVLNRLGIGAPTGRDVKPADTHSKHRAQLQLLPPRERNSPIRHRFFTKQKRRAPPRDTAKPKRPSVIIHHPPWKVPAINDPFPNLEGATQDNPSFNLYDYKGPQWAVIFTHPIDFTPVCTSEFVELLKLKDSFDASDIKIVGFSTNDSDTHRNWLMDVEAIVNGYPTDQDCPISCPNTSELSTVSTTTKLSDSIKSTERRVDFPIYSDPTLEMAVELGILDEDVKDEDGLPVTARSVYVLTPSNQIAFIATYPTCVGRNWKEILRTVQGLQLVEKNNNSIHIPSHWEKGDRVLIDPKWADSKCDDVFGSGNWERVMLPSEVQQEIAEFSSGDGGVRIRKNWSSCCGDNSSVEKDDSAVAVLPRHYMRYTNEPRYGGYIKEESTGENESSQHES